MDKYQVIVSPVAYKNIDDIYEYISKNLVAKETALNLVDKFESSILSLESLPHRFAKRQTGAYANKGYRQLFVNNFTIIFRIDEKSKTVFIITVRYSRSNF